MSKERELIKDMKILLECTDMGGLQRRADVLIGRAIELLAQPEPSLTGDQLIDMWRDGYDAGARLAKLEQEPVAWMYDWEDTIQKVSMQNRMTKIKSISERPEAFNVRPLYAVPPKREPLSNEEIWVGFPQGVHITTLAFYEGVKWAEQQHNIGANP